MDINERSSLPPNSCSLKKKKEEENRTSNFIVHILKMQIGEFFVYFLMAVHHPGDGKKINDMSENIPFEWKTHSLHYCREWEQQWQYLAFYEVDSSEFLLLFSI